MSILSKSTKAVTVLSLGFLFSQALAQDFCNATHSGTKVDVSSNAPTGDANGKGEIGTIGDYSYEEWNKTGTGKATFYSDGSFSCSFENIDDYLCRSGVLYGKSSGVNFKTIGHLYADFSLSDYTNKSGVSYAYIGVYGWTQDPLIEWYIVDSWGSQGRPTWCGTLVKTVTIDGAEYDIYKDDINQARGTIEGTKTFTQYWSIRKTARKCGSIDITAHFEAWEAAGLKMGSSLYEAKILGEAGQYPEEHNANGSFDFNYAKVYVDNSGTPKSSASTNPTSSASTPTSSASNKQATANLPGTIQMESFETNGGDEVTIYGDVVGEVKPNAYLEWTVDVANAGIYNFEVLAARADDQERKSQISLLVDGETVGSVSVLTDTSWNDLHYKAFGGTTSTSISSGVHTLRVLFNDGYVNVDNIKFAVDGNSQNTPPTSSASVPASSGSITPTSNGSEDNQKPEAIGNIRISQFGMELQVFDMQGRNLGRVSVAAGASLEEILFAKFRRSGVYLVKQGNQLTKVRVTR